MNNWRCNWIILCIMLLCIWPRPGGNKARVSWDQWTPLPRFSVPARALLHLRKGQLKIKTLLVTIWHFDTDWLVFVWGRALVGSRWQKCKLHWWGEVGCKGSYLTVRLWCLLLHSTRDRCKTGEEKRQDLDFPDATNKIDKNFYPVNFFAQLPSVDISSLGLGSEDEQWWQGSSEAPAEHSLVTQTQPPQSVVSHRSDNISHMRNIMLCHVMRFSLYRVNNGLRLTGLISWMMRVLETVLLLMRLSVTGSESGESLEDGQLGNNDTRVTTNHTKHEVNFQQLK